MNNANAVTDITHESKTNLTDLPSGAKTNKKASCAPTTERVAKPISETPRAFFQYFPEGTVQSCPGIPFTIAFVLDLILRGLNILANEIINIMLNGKSMPPESTQMEQIKEAIVEDHKNFLDINTNNIEKSEDNIEKSEDNIEQSKDNIEESEDQKNQLQDQRNGLQVNYDMTVDPELATAADCQVMRAGKRPSSADKNRKKAEGSFAIKPSPSENEQRELLISSKEPNKVFKKKKLGRVKVQLSTIAESLFATYIKNRLVKSQNDKDKLFISREELRNDFVAWVQSSAHENQIAEIGGSLTSGSWLNNIPICIVDTLFFKYEVNVITKKRGKKNGLEGVCLRSNNPSSRYESFEIKQSTDHLLEGGGCV